MPIINDMVSGFAVGDAEAAEADPTPADRPPSGLPVMSPDGLPDIQVPVAPEVLAPEPTLAEQIEAIGNADIRAQGTEIRAIMNNYSDYELGQWQAISNEIAGLYGIELNTEEERVTFGNTIQARIRSVLGIEEGENEGLEDGKIGPESLQYLDRALMSVSETEITNQAAALQNFEAQTGWRNNNRAMAELFGISFADDATDTQLKVFGRSIQAFAGGNDGAIGSQTIARLNERLDAVDAA
jgi:hypothetical protein